MPDPIANGPLPPVQDMPVTAVAVEDEPIILRYIAKQIEKLAPDIVLVGTAGSAAQALYLIEVHQPDILVTDIEMPGMSGLDLIAHTRDTSPDMHVAIISGYGNFSYAQSALRYGVSDYLLKPLEEDQLRGTMLRIRQDVLEERHLSALVAARRGAHAAGLAERLAPGNDDDPATQIERYIRAYFDRPLTLAALSAEFNYTPAYINRIFKKRYTSSPIQYQIQLRVAKAKELLLDFPKADIKDVAAAVGYDDARYFSRVFHQATGHRPSEFAQKGR